MATTVTRRRRPASATFGPRLLEGLTTDGSPLSLAAHRQRYARPPRPGDGAWPQLIDVVEQAGLRGRGGGGFPMARKMRSVADGRRRPVVVANGTEGEPASGKDTVLLARLPHLVLDGALWAAAAVGADRIEVCVDRTNTAALAALRGALAERAAYEPLPIPVELAATPPRYVAGEESALVHFINGGPAMPTATPPRPYERGVAGRPTLVQNVETLAHLTQIATRGPGWFRQVGTAAEPGTALFSVSGAVASPCIVEAPIGTRTGDILDLADGPSGPLQALLVGGFFGTWVAASAVELPCSREHLPSFGAGVIVALGADACGLTETARILAWYAAESAGQCGPCVFGLRDLAATTAALHTPEDLARLQRWSEQIDGRGGCRHPDGAVRLLRSAITVFGADLDDHMWGRPCAAASRPPTLAVPRSHTGWR